MVVVTDARMAALADADAGTLFPGRAGHTTVCVRWGSDTEALLVHGGYDGSLCNDTWVFLLPSHQTESPSARISEGATWRRLATTGKTPAARAMHAGCMMTDALFVVFGGWGGNQGLRRDTCVLDVRRRHWINPVPLALSAGPSARQGHSLLAVGAGATAAEVVLFGGDTGDTVSSELWSLMSNSEQQGELCWRQPDASGEAPSARTGHSVCLLPDGGAGHMLLCGGQAADAATLGDIHLLSIETMQWSSPQVSRRLARTPVLTWPRARIGSSCPCPIRMSAPARPGLPQPTLVPSRSQVLGDVPRPRWAAASCVLPEAGPHGLARVVLDGGRDDDGWVDEQVVIDIRGWRADSSSLVLCCHTIVPRAEGSLVDIEDTPPPLPSLSGHTLTATSDGAFALGGSLESGALPSIARRVAPRLLRWVRPDPGRAGHEIAAHGPDGSPKLFDELIGPDLLASTFTATRVGQYLFVLGGHDPAHGLLNRLGGGLRMSVLHLPSLSWHRPQRTDLTPPKLRCGHSAVRPHRPSLRAFLPAIPLPFGRRTSLREPHERRPHRSITPAARPRPLTRSQVLLPHAGGIVVFGGVRSNFIQGAGTRSRLSDELHILQLHIPPRHYAPSAPAETPAARAALEVAVEAASSEATATSTTADPVEWSGEPSHWVKQGGPFHAKNPGWPKPLAGHSATALPAPYRWMETARPGQGAMLVFGG